MDSKCRYTKGNLQVTINFKDDILSITVLDHIGCAMYGGDFSNDCLSFGKVISTKMMYDLLISHFDGDTGETKLTFTQKAKSIVMNIEYKTPVFMLPFRLTLNQHDMVPESFDKLILNKQVQELKNKISELENYIAKIDCILDTVPTVSFNEEPLFVPRKIASLFLGEVSIQYSHNGEFFNYKNVVKRHPEHYHDGRSVLEISGYRECSGSEMKYQNIAGHQTNILSLHHTHYNTHDGIKSPLWNLGNLKMLINLKYLAIDCLAVKEFNIKEIPQSVEYLYLIDPQFRTVPDFEHLINLKKMIIEGRGKSLVKDGMEQVRIFKLTHPDFIFEKNSHPDIAG